MQPIVTLTVNPAIDVNTSVDHVVAERKLRCAQPRREAGGGGVNVSRAIHRLGGSSLACFLAGGPAGDLLVQLLDGEGVTHRRLSLEDWTRENVIVDDEFQDLMGAPLDSEDDLKRAARRFVEDGRCTVLVLSLGAGGALLVTRDGPMHIRTPTVPIRSKVGAGDSMVAGLTLALARGHAVEEAVRYGVAAGAAAVMAPGTELCRKDDVDRLYDTMRADATR